MRNALDGAGSRTHFQIAGQNLCRESTERSEIMRKGRVLAILAGLALTSTLGMAQVTVFGTNTFPTDVNNVQAAVLVPGSKVYLSGTFNFGDAGQVVLSAPGVTLQGVSAGATIRGGYYPLATVPVPVVSPVSTAKNLTIRNIRFEGWGGYAIYHMGVEAEDNVVRIEGNTFVNTRWPEDDPPVYGIHYCTGGGKAVIRKNRLVGISLFAISTHDLTLHHDDFLIIEENRIEDAHLDPLVVEVYSPAAGTPDHGPVAVRNNRILISSDTPNPYIWGISLGTGYFGCAISNTLVEGNVITGRVCDGILAFPYGHNRKIVNNDLSGMTAFEGQIYAEGRRDLISGNKLGPVDTTGEYGNSFSFGIGLLALDWSPYYPGADPEPEPVTRNAVMFNDYRRTGLKGWAIDAGGNFTSMGCILLLSGVDMGWSEWWPGCEVTGNLIWELGRFPAGMGGPGRQVLEYPAYAHDNFIFGQSAGGDMRLAAAAQGAGLTSRGVGMTHRTILARKLDSIRQKKVEREGR
jgi:hypothetical protein